MNDCLDSKCPVVSVIMLTYNRENVVARMIECILAQTFKNFEFIIVDNGSTDNSGRICDDYAVRDKRIRVIHCERGNIGRGRNVGLEVARCQFVTFVDDDDIVASDFLKFLYDLLETNNADVAICGATDRNFDEKRIMSAEEALIELMWRKLYNVAFPTKMFRRELISGLHFPETGRYDDIALMYKLLSRADKVAYHGLAKYTFVRHVGNNSFWTTNHEALTAETLREYLAAYAERTSYISNLYPNIAANCRYFEWSFMISMVEKIVRFHKEENCETELKYMLDVLLENRQEFLNCPWILLFEKEWFEDYVKERT